MAKAFSSTIRQKLWTAKDAEKSFQITAKGGKSPTCAFRLTLFGPKANVTLIRVVSLGRYGMRRAYVKILGACLLLGGFAAPAKADLKLCNNTASRVGVAIGYKDKEGWASEGWWTAEPNKCLNLLKGSLIARYYYVYAVDYEKGGSWGGKSMMCIRDKIFTIRGFDNCDGRGYSKVGFFEVDTGEESDWTISLSGEKTTQGNP
jgi:uncharacterized membrane protein